MIWVAVVATFGASFLLVWQLLNWLVGHVRWLPKGSMIVTGEPVTRLPEGPACEDPDCDWSGPAPLTPPIIDEPVTGWITEPS